MAGKIRKLIDELVAVRTKGSASVAHFVRAHLVLSGIDPDRFDETSADDPDIVARLEKMIEQFRPKE